jgi:hypothetical protein
MLPIFSPARPGTLFHPTFMSHGQKLSVFCLKGARVHVNQKIIMTAVPEKGDTSHLPAPSACLQEEFYVEENVEKAIRIDDFQGDVLTTSMVDDVFFILQKCGQRALASGNLQCVCAILGQLNNLLASNLRQALDSRWKVRSLS